MSDQAFKAIVSVEDKVSPAIQKMEERIAAFGQKTAQVAPTVEQQLAKMGERLAAIEAKANEANHATEPKNESRWSHFNEILGESKQKFAQIAQGAAKFGEKLVEIFPEFAALGSIGSTAGIFELAQTFAENSEALELSAQKIGVTTQSLQTLDYAAKQTGLNTDQFNDDLLKLNKNLGVASVGKDKDLASYLKHLHVALRTTKGGVIDAATALPALEKAFAATTSSSQKAFIAQVAFGKSGLDMILFLNQGPQKVAELQAQFVKLGYVYTDADKANGDRFNESWKNMQTAFGGFTDELGAKLAPVLTPIIDKMTDWISANREWIATDIGKAIQWVEDKAISWFKSMGGMDGLQRDFKDFGSDVHEAIGFVESLARGVKDLMAAWHDVSGFFSGIAKDIGKLNSAISNFGMTPKGYYVMDGNRPVFRPDPTPAPTNDNESAGSPVADKSEPSGHWMYSGRRKFFVPDASLPAASRAATAQIDGKVSVDVTVNGVPPGSRVQSTSPGAHVKSPRLKVGYSSMSRTAEDI